MDIQAHNVYIKLDGATVVDNATLTCTPGTMTALVGPSGSGKTTLLHCLGLMLAPTSGRVVIEGVEASNWSDRRRRRFWVDHAAFVLQDYGIIDDESVAFNITMSASLFRRRVHDRDGRIAEVLDHVGLSGRAGELAAHLSGGERQRLAIARAIHKQAQVIYVDEPTASLDDANRKLVITHLQERAREGSTVIIATHDHDVIAACDGRHELDPTLQEASL